MKSKSRTKLLNISESHQKKNVCYSVQHSLEDLNQNHLPHSANETKPNQNTLKNPLPLHSQNKSGLSRAGNHSSQGTRKQSKGQFAQLNLSLSKFVMENNLDKVSLPRGKGINQKGNARDSDLSDIVVLGINGKPSKSRGLLLQSQNSKQENSDSNLPSLIMLQRDSKNRNIYRKFAGSQVQSTEKIHHEGSLSQNPSLRTEKQIQQEIRISKLQNLQARRAQYNHSVDSVQKSANNLQNSQLSQAGDNQLIFSLKKEELANLPKGFIGSKKLSHLKQGGSESNSSTQLTQSIIKLEKQKAQIKTLEKERAQVQQSLESLKCLMIGGEAARGSKKQLSIKNDAKVQKIYSLGKRLTDKRDSTTLNQKSVSHLGRKKDLENTLEEIIQTEEDMNEQQLMIYEDDDLSDNSTFNSYANNPINVKSHLISDTSNQRIMEQIKPFGENLYKSQIVKRDRPGTDIKKKTKNSHSKQQINQNADSRKDNIFGNQKASNSKVPMATAQFGSESLISTSGKNYSDTTQATINPSIIVQSTKSKMEETKTTQRVDSQRQSKVQKEQSIYMLTFNNSDNKGKDLASRENELKQKLLEKEEEKRMSIASSSKDKDQYNQTSNFANFIPEVEVTQLTEGQLLKTSSRSHNQNQANNLQPFTGQIQLLRPNQSLIDPQDKSSFLNPSQYNKQSYEQDTFALSNSQVQESRDFGGAKLFSPDFQSNGKQLEVVAQLINSGSKEKDVTDFLKIQDYMNQDMSNLGNFNRQTGIPSVQRKLQKIFELEMQAEEDVTSRKDPQININQSIEFNWMIDQTPLISKRPFSMCNKTRSASQSNYKARPISCANVKNSILPPCFIDDRSQHSSEKMGRRNGSAQSQQRPPIVTQKPPHHLSNPIILQNSFETNERSFSTNKLKQENGSRNKVLRSKIKTEIHSWQNNSLNYPEQELEETSNFGGNGFGYSQIRRGAINFNSIEREAERAGGEFKNHICFQEGNFMSAKKGDGLAHQRASKNNNRLNLQGTFDQGINPSNLKHIPPIPRAPQRRIQSSNQPYRKPVVSKKFMMKMTNDNSANLRLSNQGVNQNESSKFIHLIDIDQKSQESK